MAWCVQAMSTQPTTAGAKAITTVRAHACARFITLRHRASSNASTDGVPVIVATVLLPPFPDLRVLSQRECWQARASSSANLPLIAASGAVLLVVAWACIKNRALLVSVFRRRA